MEISHHKARIRRVLPLVVLFSCLFDAGCTPEAMALLQAMAGGAAPSGTAASPTGGMLRPGSQPSSALSSFDPLAAGRSLPPSLVTANGPVQRSPGGFNPLGDNFPQPRHPGGELIAAAPESFGGGGPLGFGGNEGGGRLSGDAGFGSGM